MKVAIIRGSSMNRFEMQSYGPVAREHELTGYASQVNGYELQDIGFPIKRLPIAEQYYSFLPWPLNSLIYGAMLPLGYNFRMFGLERELEGQDILHAAETFNGYSYQAARVRNEKKKKLVLTVWENVPFLSVRSFKGLSSNEAIVRYVRESTDMFIAVTGRARQALLIEGVKDDRIRTIPAGIDTDRFRPGPADPGTLSRMGVAEGDLKVLFIGRLVREKGVLDLLYAARLASMDKSLDNVKFILAGGGPEKEHILSLARSMGIDDRISIPGSFSYGEVHRLYNSADIFILPSIPTPVWQEQFGMVLAEAMASGLPVISTLSGSIPEVVGDSGVLIQPNDPVSIYHEVKRLATDGAARGRLGLAARERAENNFNINKVSRQIEAVYRELS